MEKMKWIKKGISALLALNMVLSSVPLPAFAVTTDNLCDHHTEHTAECGYREGSAGSACTHEHSEDCYEILECLHTHNDECDDPCTHECTVDNGCITMELDCRHVHGDCGYSEGTAEVPCGHVHNENCGYVEAVAGNPCANAETDPECDHLGSCGYVAAVEGQPCGHTACDDTCGYAPATEGTPCTHVCEVKVDSDDSCYKLLCSHKDGGHDDACGYAEAVEAHECHYECAECAENEKAPSERGLSAELTGGENPLAEGATGAEEVCTCGTDDPAIHATTCTVYVAPENPVCKCAMKCTEPNEWCDICGFDITACTGEDTAVPYAECTCEVKCAENNVNGECAVCSAEGADLSACIGTVAVLEGPIDATTMTADEMKAAVAEKLAVGATDIEIILAEDTDATMFSAITAALAADDIADGSINLTISGAKTVPEFGFFDNDNYFENGEKNIAGDKLKSLTLTDVETIGDFAFSACTYLESVNLPQVVTIGECAFNEWKKGTKLTSLDLPNATTIGDWAFAYSSLLTSINLPKVTNIGVLAFGYCDLRTLNLPEVTTIDGEAFLNNYNLVSCSAPKATTIDYYPWGNCSRLETLELTAAGGFTLGNNLFANTPTGQINLVLNKDKESQVTQNADGTATWKTTNSNGGKLEYTFKSITFVYSIEVSAIENGAVTADKSTATEGETVTLTVTAAEGYILDTLTVMNGDTPVEVTGNSFTMPAGDVTVSATFKACDHSGSTHTSATDLGDGKHSFTCSVCDTSVTEPHSIGTDGKCACGLTFWTVEGNTLTIDGTLGGKETATEEDLAAMVELLRSYIESGNTTIIVTGNNQAKLLTDGYLTPVVSLAFEQLTYVYQDENIDSYWGTVDLIYQDVTEIVEYEFYVCDVLRSITLPKVTKVGDRGFWACYYLETLTFGSVVTDITDNSGEVFYDLGYKIGDCNLVLNCGQMNTETEYQPNLDTRIWWNTEWKSITLTHADDAAYTDNGDGTHSFTCTTCGNTVTEEHSGGTATCTTLAVCDTCGKEYGDVDKTNHDETVAFDSNGFCPNGCYEPAVRNGEVYEISNAGQLYWFAQKVNNGETTINAILMNDIAINSQVLDADGNLISDTSGLRQWTPIGHYNSDTDNLGFAGTFDGNGKTISSLYHYGDTARYAGLFGYSAGTIRDLTIADAYIHTTHSDGRAGAVTGLNYGTVSICHNSGFVSGVNQVGGIVGRINAGSVENCSNSGTISGNQYVGGICGNVAGGAIRNCSNHGTVSGTEYIGGITGSNSGAIEKCSNHSTVSGNRHVGGIAALVSDGIINNCYNIGAVEATGNRAGGIAGCVQFTSNISNCFSSGTVKGSLHVGGVVGLVAEELTTNVKITNCYHDNLIYSGNAVGYNSGSKGSGTLTKVEGKTTEAFASGELTWLLNGESAEGIWKQTLDTDTYPSFSGKTVYCGYSNGCFEDAKFYTNNPEEATERADHTFDNGVCTVCGAYEPAADSDADGYYEIYNVGNLFWFAQKVNSGENTINAKLMADIDLENRAWTPMGTHDDTNSAKNCHFKGTFDGNYHIVKNLSVTVEDNCEAGFFGRAEGATIQNFGIVNARVEGKGGYRVGVIGGELYKCTVTNVFSAGEITLITDNAQKGGIAGESHSSTLNGCFTTYSNLTASANVTVTNCYYLAEEASSASAGMNMSANKFTSGELTWLLNGESAEGIWKQTLDTDTYPSFTGGTVYHGNCGGGVPYSNVAEETMNHTFNAENGYRCSNTLLSGGICNIYESAAQNADGYYEIYNASQLYWFAEQVNGGEKSINAVLMNDIDLTNHTWTPIGVTAMGESVTDGYTGTFDGQGHVISNITFAAPTSAMAAGIFGTVQSGGTVKNLGVENLTFDNNDYDHRAAGIAGQLLADSTISDCYVINSTVKASSRVVGGIVGMNKGTVKNCYTCNMTLAGYNNRFGGISGDYSGGKLENCYTDYSALASSEAGTTTNCEAGVSAERFASGEIAYALGNGWGQTIGTDGCPVFGGATVYQVANIGCPAQGEYVYSNVNEAVAAAHKYTNGFCACGGYEEAVQNADGYYVIDNAGKLFWFAELVNGGNNTINAVLTADIDLENRPWTPIGTQNESVSPNVKMPYMGVFDGQCHVIKNLSIHVTDGREAGLFGRAQDATLLNFGVVDAAVVSDPVNGTGYRAGIVAGELHRCTVANVYSAGNLTVTTTHAQAGGIAGECADSTLTNCFTTYGCLTASNADAVTNCYYLAESENTGSCGDYKTADQFASGEVAWLLNGSTDQGDLVWYQNIGMDAYPKFEGLVVNYNTDSDTYHNGNTVSVSISWTEMSFTYTAGEWDPETHTYTGSWAADDGAAQITVKNVGAANVPVRFTFAGTMGEVTGRFDVEKAALAPGRAATTTLTVSGDPQKSGFVDEQIGTVTVSLGSSGWTTGEKVTFYAKDGKDYPSTVAEVTDAKMVLVSDYVGIHWNYNLSGNGADGTFSYFQSTYLDPVGARFPAAWTAEYYNFVVPYIENHQSHIICVYSRGNKRLAVWADQVKVSSTFQNLGHIAYFYIWDVEFAE
ncbi:MAG: leucine-rich repeat protein [Oscillospiraceae bacterium]|nr:leucine-rich repeat protein [Oscillospiraceae bacterium]